MAILLYRIDDRLVHGQVVVGWGRVLKAEAILVASDRAANDELAKTMMEMGAPANVKVEVLPVGDAAARIRDGYYDDRATIVLIETPDDALRLVDGGVAMERLNVGGMHFCDGKRLLMEAVSVDARDCRSLREIGRRGIDVYVQMVPNAKAVDLIGKLPDDL